MRDALMVALKREADSANGEKTKKLYQLAEAMVDKAITGDVSAATFVADRVDGRPAQALEHMGEGGGPIEIVRRIVHATTGT
jgi:hypothetical protein